MTIAAQHIFKMLEYDNSAFYYFAIGILMVFLLPATFFFVKGIIGSAISRARSSQKARTSAEVKKVKQLSEDSKISKKVFTKGFLIKLCLLVVGWSVVFGMFSMVGDDAQIQSFNPFEILGVDESAEERDIKKAYRKLTLKWHPDRWVNADPDEQAIAGQRFSMVAKAHEALTDPIAMENWKKFGNPDGRQALEVSIGLPSFIIEKGNQNLVLLVYLIVLVVLVPLCVGIYYSRSQQYGENMILNETYGVFYKFITENTVLRHIPEIVACAAEFRTLPQRGEEEAKVLHRLLREMEQEGHMPSKPWVILKNVFNQFPACFKANILIHAHLSRKTGDEHLTPALQNDLKKILSQFPGLINAMIEISKYRRSGRTTANIIEFGQYVAQALWLKDNDLLQLPHFTTQEVRHCISGKGKIKNIQQFLVAEPQERLGMRKKGMATFSEEEVADVDRMVSILPHIKLEVTAGVVAQQGEDKNAEPEEWEEDCCTADLVTICCKITRENLSPGETSQPIHAPYLPYSLPETWYLQFTSADGSRMFEIANVDSDDRVVVHKFQFPAPPVGQHSFMVVLKSSGIIGLDKKKPVKLTIIDDDKVKRTYAMHPEDKELDNEPSLFEAAFGMVEDGADSDFTDDEEEEEDENDALTADDEPVLVSKEDAAAPAPEKDEASKKND